MQSISETQEPFTNSTNQVPNHMHNMTKTYNFISLTNQVFVVYKLPVYFSFCKFFILINKTHGFLSIFLLYYFIINKQVKRLRFLGPQQARICPWNWVGFLYSKTGPDQAMCNL